MLAEMRDIFWMDQVLDLCILVVVFLEVVDLVLILIITVMARTKPEVWQLLAGSTKLNESLS